MTKRFFFSNLKSENYFQSANFRDSKLKNKIKSSYEYCGNQMKNRNYHTNGTIPKSKIYRRHSGQIHIPNTHMTAHFPGLIQTLQ